MSNMKGIQMFSRGIENSIAMPMPIPKIVGIPEELQFVIFIMSL